MEENKINTIGKDFTITQLTKFVLPAIVSRLFTALLNTLDDSLFLSRYCGQNALAAFSIAMPWFMFVDAFAMVLSATAVKCSILLGEKKNDEANSSFTTMCLVTVVVGLVFTLTLTLFRKNILTLLGETEILMPFALEYMNISRFYTPMVLLSSMFSRFFIVSGKPKWDVAKTVVSTCLNFFFDWLFLVRLNTGIVGTAYANLISNIVCTLIGLVFFFNKKHEIHFAKPTRKVWPLLKDVFHLGKTGGLTSLAVSLNSFISNHVLLSVGGEMFVSAFTIVNNVQFMFMNAFFGMVGSISPISSYAYGEKNPKKLSKTLKQALVLVLGLSCFIALLFIFCKDTLIGFYLPEGSYPTVKQLVEFGMKIVPFIYPVFGFNVMVQEMLISVDNHSESIRLSLIENVLFANLSTILLPTLFGANGVWFAFLVGELLTLSFSLIAVNKYKNVYGYGKLGIASFVDDNRVIA